MYSKLITEGCKMVIDTLFVFTLICMSIGCRSGVKEVDVVKIDSRQMEKGKEWSIDHRDDITVDSVVLDDESILLATNKGRIIHLNASKGTTTSNMIGDDTSHTLLQAMTRTNDNRVIILWNSGSPQSRVSMVNFEEKGYSLQGIVLKDQVMDLTWDQVNDRLIYISNAKELKACYIEANNYLCEKEELLVQGKKYYGVQASGSANYIVLFGKSQGSVSGGRVVDVATVSFKAIHNYNQWHGEKVVGVSSDGSLFTLDEGVCEADNEIIESKLVIYSENGEKRTVPANNVIYARLIDGKIIAELIDSNKEYSARIGKLNTASTSIEWL